MLRQVKNEPLQWRQHARLGLNTNAYDVRQKALTPMMLTTHERFQRALLSLYY